MNKENLHHLLLRSLDEELSSQEQQQLDGALKASTELQRERDKLLKMRQLLATQDYSFKPFFAAKVLQKINATGTEIPPDVVFFNALFTAFKRVTVSGAMLIGVLLLYNYYTEGYLSVNSLLGMNNLQTDDLLSLYLYDF